MTQLSPTIAIEASPAVSLRKPVSALSRAVVWWQRMPRAAVASVLLIALLHVAASMIAFPEPIARDGLRHKVMALTATHRPAIIIAGDSRAQKHLIPALMAAKAFSVG